MSQETTQSTETTTEVPAPETTDKSLGEFFTAAQAQAAAQLAAAESRARAMPAELKDKAIAALEKLRITLDLPSRSELVALTERIDELAGKLAEYEAAAASKGGKKKNDKAEQA
jgi:hypothetical protein